MTWSKSESRPGQEGPGEETENTLSGREEQTWSDSLVRTVVNDPAWKGEEGSSKSVAEISASMICPGVISMGMPSPGVEGRGGDAGRVLRREGREANDTGEVGRDTVMGIELVAPVRVKLLLGRGPVLGTETHCRIF